MEKITYSESVVDFLNDLVLILHRKEYFGFIESAKEYRDKVVYDIENYISVKKHHPSPKRLLKYGEYYATFKGSKRTTWYVFFNKVEDFYVIKFITNNHTATASFIRGLK